MFTSGDLFAFAGLSVSILITMYAAYWAFGIRKALSVGLYRNQALGIGLIALGFAVFNPYSEANVPFITNGAFGTWLLTYYPPFILIFYWADASARAARRSDPLLRDSLRWSKVRSSVWGLTFALIAFYTATAIYNQLFGISESLGIPVLLVGLVPLFGPLLLSAFLLSVNARRSGDQTLRKHLEWFGFFTLSLFIGGSIGALTYPYHHIGFGLLIYILLPIGAYSLYRSARALVPLNRVSTLETD